MQHSNFWQSISAIPLKSNFPHEYHNIHLHNLNIALNHQGATPVEQMRYVVNEASLLVSVIVDQPIIQVAISSTETCGGNRNKFEAWIALVENVAQISGQDILQIAFSKIGRLTTHFSPQIRRQATKLNHGVDSKANFPSHILQLILTVMPPRLWPIYNKVQMNYLKCIYTMQGSFNKKSITSDMSQISVEGLTHYIKLQKVEG